MPPRLTLRSPEPWQLFKAPATVSLDAPFTDPGSNDTHHCTVDWDDGTVETFAQEGNCGHTHVFEHAGMFTVNVTVTDDDGGTDCKQVLVIVYDPTAGRVTGGGFIESPASAFVPDPSATGKAHVNSEVRYRDANATVPEGHVSFRLAAADLDLTVSALEWLVVTPDGKLAVKGTGTSGPGGEDVGFVLYGYDGCVGNQTSGCQPGPDRLRMVLWPLSAGDIPGATLRYDNVPGADPDIDRFNPQPVTGGSIQIHR